MWHHKLHRGGNLVKTLADIGGSIGTGIAALSSDITLESQTVSPLFRYEAKDASVSSWPGVVGETLTGGGSGGEVGRNTPLLDDSECLRGNGTRYWDGASTIAQGTKDRVYEVVYRLPNTVTASESIFSTYTATQGVIFRRASTTTSTQFYTAGASGARNMNLAGDNVWQHAVLFCHHSTGNSGYINGDYKVAATGALGTISDNGPLRVNALLVGNVEIAYFACWEMGSWLSGYRYDSFVSERFAKLTGVWATQFNKGPDQSLLRNSVATLEKQSSDGTQKLFTVGARWPRIETRPDKFHRYWSGYNSEASHTNLLTYSEELDNIAWTKTRATISANAVESPDGETTMDTIVEDATASNTHYVEQSFTQSAAAYTLLCVVKPASRQWVQLELDSTTDGAASVYFDVSNGVTGTQSGNDGAGSRYIGGGRYLLWLTDTRATAEACSARVYLANSNGGRSYSGASLNGVYCWGMQVTSTAYPVSYIKTSGATVTRLADRLQYDGLTLGAAGSIACDVLRGDDVDANTYVVSVSDGGASTDRVSQLLDATSDAGRSVVVDGGATQADVTGTTVVDDYVWREIRTLFAANNVKTLIDGSSEGTPDTSATIPSALDRIDIGSSEGGASHANALIRLRLLSKAVENNVTDFGAIMAKSSAYISTPSAVAQSTAYANVGGTFTEVNSSDFTVSAAGVFTYTGTATKRFAAFAACSASISSGTPEVTTAWEKNGSEVASSVSRRDVGSSAIGAWGVAADIELANGDTLNLATKVDAGTPNLTMESCSAVIVEAGN